MVHEPTDKELVKALDDALAHVGESLQLLADLRQHEQGVRGEAWAGGWQEVVTAEGQAREALHRMRCAHALLTLAIETEPLVLQRML